MSPIHQIAIHFVNTIHIYFQVVKIYFCIQATSCSAERTFSTGGSTVTTKRTKLDPVNVNMLVYVRENMNKIKIEKLVLEDQEEEKLEKECNSDTEL